MTSFWRNNDVVIALHVCWDVIDPAEPLLKYNVVFTPKRRHNIVWRKNDVIDRPMLVDFLW